MAFFTDFIKEYGKLQDESESLRGVRTPTTGQRAGLSDRFGSLAGAEVSARADQATLGQREYELELGQQRFQDKLNLASRKLDLEDKAMDRQKRMLPWTVGLGLGDIGLSWYGNQQQKSRDREYRDMMGQILGSRTQVPQENYGYGENYREA